MQAQRNTCSSARVAGQDHVGRFIQVVDRQAEILGQQVHGAAGQDAERNAGAGESACGTGDGAVTAGHDHGVGIVQGRAQAFGQVAGGYQAGIGAGGFKPGGKIGGFAGR
jgi:hypothetical protein